MAELFVQAGQFGFVASGLLPKRVGRAHLGSSRRGEAVRRGGAVRRVGILQRRGGGGVLQHRGGGQVLQHRGGAVRVRRVGALAEESRKSSSRFDVGKLFVEVVEEFFNVKVVEDLFSVEVV